MRLGWYNRSAQCPFYQSVLISKGGQIIGVSCESLDDNLGFDVQTLIRFVSKKEMRDFFELFCADYYQTCPYYKAIYKKYEDK